MPLLYTTVKAKRGLQTKQSLCVIEPKHVAEYFKNVRRGSICAIRDAFVQSLPKRAFLDLMFMTGLVQQANTNTRLKKQLVETLLRSGINEIPDLKM